MRRVGRSTDDAAGVAGPGRIFISGPFSARICVQEQELLTAKFAKGKPQSSQRDSKRALSCAGLFVWDGFSRGFHRISSGFTVSAQIILCFALCSLMLKWANASQC